MARSKPYTFTLGIIDLVLFLCTAGGWGLVMIVRELYRHGQIATK